MVSVLVTANAADGHVSPMLGVAEHLVRAGHRVRFLTGTRFADAVRATGADYLPWSAEADLDHEQVMREMTAEQGRLSGPRGMAASVERVFIAPAAGQYASVQAALDAEPADVLVTEFTVVGVAALALDPGPHPPVVACGILPLGITSRDTAPWGLGILPRPGPLGRLRNHLLNRVAKDVVLRKPQRRLAETVRELTGGRLTRFFMDWAVDADHYAQFSVPGFEYPRSDLPANVSFLGPVVRAAQRVAPEPAWWGDLDGSRPVVHVSQGTVANESFDDLVLPTLRALADRDVLVVVTTGGPDPAVLGPLPANARAAAYISYDDLMEKVDVFVTNGGYGGLNFALAHGVPIVTAGDTEDKAETTRRVEYTGVGINLHTGAPDEAAIAAAVDRVLTEPGFRRRAEALRDEIAAAPGLPGLEQIVLDVVARRSQ